MQNLWVVLHTGHAALGALESGNRSTLGGGRHLETLGGLRYGISVAHPHLVLGRQAGVQLATGDLQRGASVLTQAGLCDRATQSVGHGLETIADSENGNAQLQQAFNAFKAENETKLAAKAGVKAVVISHLSPSPEPNDDFHRYADTAKKHFNGPVTIAKDLMKF